MRKFLFFFLPIYLFAFTGTEENLQSLKPWFTGPLLAGSGNVTQVGHYNVEPYFFATARTSFYNNNWKSESIETLWNLQFRVPVWIGLTKWADFKVVPNWFWNYRDHQSQWTLGDWAAQVSFQLHRAQLPEKSWLPSIKLIISETFPTGKYQKLNPHKLGTDSTGLGTWRTGFGLNFSKIFQVQDAHFLNTALNFSYSVGVPFSVRGYNAYGGGNGTKGTIHPEHVFLTTLAFEYSLTQRWAIACDLQGIWQSSTSFSGRLGTVPSHDINIDPEGIPASNDRLAAMQYSLAPALEYNWSDNLGLIGGVWFTFAGKNSSHFTSGVIALNYYR